MRERAGSVAVALGVQAGLFLLLLFSLAVVHRLPQEKETILTLPPLPRPVLKPAMVIDGRPRRPLRPSAAPPPPMPSLPVPAAPAPQAAPAQGEAVLPALGRALADCRPEKLANLPPAARAQCPPPAPQAKRDDSDLMQPNRHVKDEDYYAAEKANRDAPFALPGAAGGPLGILLTALFNPGAWADKHSYSLGPPVPPKGGVAAGPAPRQHVSDTRFQDALNAVNARKGAITAKPAPPPPDAGAAEAGAAAP
jgi:hypothetical protein